MIKGRFMALVTILLIAVISLFKIPDFITTRQLESLGFSETAIDAIKAKNLASTIITNSYYSDYLDQEVSEDDFNSDYLILYVIETSLTEDDFLLYDKLLAKGYSEDAVINLFRELEFNELVPLLVFDLQTTTAAYISDCITNRENNSDGSFILDGDYLNAYENVSESPDIGTSSVLVSKKFSLGEYIPDQLTPLTVQYASDGVQLNYDAYTAFIAMVDAMREEGLYIYALSGYRSYEDQASIYNSYSSTDAADAVTTRAGHSEAQTGLSITIVDSANESLSNFVNTDEYQFIVEHAHEYGFIIRYPENKSSITGYDFIPYQIRYVGVEYATGVYETGLTWEEYYLLYIAEW